MRNNRSINQLRDIQIIPNFSDNPEGSCLIKCGNTHVICSASLDRSLPRWLKNSEAGWVTAEYGMLPRSTSERMFREAAKGKQSGRTQEIQRLIGRSLRSIVNLEDLKDLQVIIDCDVIQADGGTRTASISGSFIALQLCINTMLNKKISCGIVNGEPLLDLDFEEDQNADVDANFVITESGKLVEVQMTSEKKLCEERSFNAMLKLAKSGISEIIQKQKQILSD